MLRIFTAVRSINPDRSFLQELKKNISVSLFLLISIRANSQEVFTTLALTAADNTGYGYYTFAKPGLYFSIGKSQALEAFSDSRFNYGLAFSQKGARKAPDPANNDPVEYNVRLNYAEANMQFWLKMKSLKFIIGLNGGYLVNYSEKSVYGITVTGASYPYRKLDFSLTGGLGVNVGKNWLFHLSGTYSIIPVRSIGTVGTIAFSRGPRNTLVNIGFTYIFFKKAEPEDEPVEE